MCCFFTANILDLPSNYDAVTATSYDLRFASYEIKLENDDHSSAIPDVRFSEYQDAPAGKPWAKWDCDSRGYMVELVLERSIYNHP